MSLRKTAVLFLPLLLLAAGKGSPAGWRQDFRVPEKGDAIPGNWELKKKLGTPAALFTVVAAENTDGVLKMTADKATASIVSNPEKLDLKKTPILRWRWRVLTLPKCGDGRKAATDDQAIGIYLGTGSIFSKKSVSYRWDTVTPKGADGTCRYGGGTIKIKWFTLRNESDGLGEWKTDQRNIAEDFKAAWGFVPDDIYVSISCNSQYTESSADAELDWIELIPDTKGKTGGSGN